MKPPPVMNVGQEVFLYFPPRASLLSGYDDTLTARTYNEFTSKATSPQMVLEVSFNTIVHQDKGTANLESVVCGNPKLRKQDGNIMTRALSNVNHMSINMGGGRNIGKPMQKMISTVMSKT